MAQTSLYEVLGVSRTATDVEVFADTIMSVL